MLHCLFYAFQQNDVEFDFVRKSCTKSHLTKILSSLELRKGFFIWQKGANKSAVPFGNFSNGVTCLTYNGVGTFEACFIDLAELGFNRFVDATIILTGTFPITTAIVRSLPSTPSPPLQRRSTS